jgi:hypothetical protein
MAADLTQKWPVGVNKVGNVFLLVGRASICNLVCSNRTPYGEVRLS